jgi:hypothetical protein
VTDQPRTAHPPHNHESTRIPPPRSVTDACPGCIAAAKVRRHDDHLPSDDPAVEAVASALASSGAEWHGDHRCTGCAMTLRNRLREHGYDALIEAEAAAATGLDVERLARALHVVFEEKWPKVGVLPDVPVTVFGGYAEDIAKAYETVE